MTKRLVLFPAAILWAFVHAMLWPPSAEASRSVSACGTLDVLGETYNLTADISAGAGDCLVVANHHIKVNLQGHRILGIGSGSAITDAGVSRDGTIVNGAPPAGSRPGTANGGV